MVFVLPKPFIRIFALLTFIVPIIVLPFTEGPKIAIPTSAFLFSFIYFFSFLPLIYFEEKNLLEKYGEEYQEYRKKFPTD
jgi:protein-S-isoprenylcysteine O-methyltransferase Ste14